MEKYNDFFKNTKEFMQKAKSFNILSYNAFFKNTKEFMQKAEMHKRRGNNDFNPYLEMLSSTDEVRLHSSLLYGFLYPQNNHYQGDVFLEAFLESIKWQGIKLKEWFGSTSNAKVHREYKNIDIYITNGYKHIIIENKLEARDQKRQIERYIETIAKEQSLESCGMDSDSETKSSEIESISYENIFVLYLTLHDKNPTQCSLGEWKIPEDYDIQEDYLVKGDNQVGFKKILYEKEILAWIDKSQKQVGCITNLNSALLFYKDVVQIITNTKENTMSIEQFLIENNTQENMEVFFEILNLSEESKKKIVKSYYIKKYKDEIENKGFEIIKGTWRINMDYELVIRPKKHDKVYVAFCVRYDKKKLFHSTELFFPYHENENDAERGNYNKEIIEIMGKQGMNFKNENEWYLNWEWDFITTFEKELQNFLNENTQKKYNTQINQAQNELSNLIKDATLQ